MQNNDRSWVGSSVVKMFRSAVRPGVIESSERGYITVQGVFWTIVGYGGSQLLRLGSTLILARYLLAPEVFGLFALLNIFLTGLEMLSDLGIGMDVVQHRRGDDPDFISTAFLIQAGRGIILWAIALALVYPFALFYNQPDLRMLGLVGAFSVAVRGVASGSVWLMTRHLQVKKLAMLNVGGDAVGLMVTITWAFISPTAWALVAGRLAMTLAFTIGSHLVADSRVSLRWDREAARDIFAFGGGMFLTSVTYFLGGEAERLIVAKFIPIAELGCFSLAVTLSAAPAQLLGQIAGKVFFPLISQNLREDPNGVVTHFRRARIVFLVVSILVGVGFIAYSHRFVALLLPPQYASTGWMLQWLGFRAAQQIFAAPTSCLILAYGNSKQGAVANIIRSILMLVGMWWGFTIYGMQVAIAFLAIAYVAAYLALIPALAQHSRPSLRVELQSFAVFSICMVLAAMIPWPGR